MKPTGFWVSIEHPTEDYFGWKDWCQSEEWNQDGLQYKAIINVDPEASVLELPTIQDMYRFNKDYGVLEEDRRMRNPWSNSNDLMYIDWDQVYEKYSGIFIYPYHHTLRLENNFMWYYGFDCSSGCIWDLSIVTGVTIE